jgi:hypothetical protein
MAPYKTFRGQTVKIVVTGPFDGHGLGSHKGLDVFVGLPEVGLAKDGPAFGAGKDQTLDPSVAFFVATSRALHVVFLLSKVTSFNHNYDKDDHISQYLLELVNIILIE